MPGSNSLKWSVFAVSQQLTFDCQSRQVAKSIANRTWKVSQNWNYVEQDIASFSAGPETPMRHLTADNTEFQWHWNFYAGDCVEVE
jgi:hypothetical protein